MKIQFKNILFLYFLSLSAFAKDSVYSAKEAQEILGENPYEPNYFSMLLGLFTVIILIYATSFVYQKLLKIKVSPDVKENEIEIVTSKSLGQNKNLYIIKVKDNYSLIGATQNNITYLKDIDNTLK